MAAVPGAGAAPAAVGATDLTTIFSRTSLGITEPDDLTLLGDELFVAFQNGLGPQGQPSPTGARASTVVEMTTSGVYLDRWSIIGHVDGLTDDPADGLVVVTANGDANSNLSTIDPATGAVAQYRYAADPLPHNGGTDAISFWRGQLLISASAPGTLGGKQAAAPQASYPAVYRVTLTPAKGVAQVSGIFFDEADAVDRRHSLGDSSAGKPLSVRQRRLDRRRPARQLPARSMSR